MKQIVFCVVLLLATFLLAQQQEQPPPPTAQPTFPQPQTPGEEMTPATHTPPEETVSGKRVQTQILQQLRAEPSLAGKNVNQRLTTIIVLTGTVYTMAHSNLAAREL